mmetsp:Transcript_1192/g.1439  ORF Transcript_1192/g.1439 Transcript_1192/m.1439 type:complete len:206 (+) Transcript_1192:1242-1859(+)
MSLSISSSTSGSGSGSGSFGGSSTFGGSTTFCEGGNGGSFGPFFDLPLFSRLLLLRPLPLPLSSLELLFPRRKASGPRLEARPLLLPPSPDSSPLSLPLLRDLHLNLPFPSPLTLLELRPRSEPSPGPRLELRLRFFTMPKTPPIDSFVPLSVQLVLSTLLMSMVPMVPFGVPFGTVGSSCGSVCTGMGLVLLVLLDRFRNLSLV